MSDPSEPSPGPEPPAPTAPARHDGGRWGRVLSGVLLGAVLVLLGTTALGRELRAPPFWLAAAVTFLPYLYAAFGVLLFGAWSALPDRRALPVLLAALLGAAASLWGPGWASRRETAVGAPVRVLSWNLRRLWGGPADEGDPVGCVVRAVEAVAPDALALLEVSAEDVLRLEPLLEMRCVHHPYRSDGGNRRGGLAACTRGERWSLRSGAGQRFVDDEDWYYVFSEVEHQGRVFNLLAVHLYPFGYDVARRLRAGVSGLGRGEADELRALGRRGQDVARGQADQSAALLDRMGRLKDPTVLAGDFNSTRDTSLHTSLRRNLTDAWERGGFGFGGTIRLFDRLPLRIDYVYASPELAVGGAEIPDPGCSDHRPVVADLVLRE